MNQPPDTHPLDQVPDEALLARIHPLARAGNLVRVPSNPAAAITGAQLDGMFPTHLRRELAWMVESVAKHSAQITFELEGITDGA